MRLMSNPNTFAYNQMSIESQLMMTPRTLFYTNKQFGLIIYKQGDSKNVS
jgi:hypothetical protein